MFAFAGAVHNDPDHFPEPRRFWPRRFLNMEEDPEPEVDEVACPPGQTFRHDERVMIFGVGKRRCIGEVLARAEVYLAFCNLVRRFK